MKPPSDPIKQFTNLVRSRLNLFRFFDLFFRSSLIGISALLLVCLYYILQGYAVPKLYYATCAGLIVVTSLIWFVIRIRSRDQAAAFADRFFGLKDSISSYLHFEAQNKSGDFYELQADASRDSVEGLKPESIPYEWPRRILTASAVLLLAAGLTAFKKPSAAVLDKLRIETETSSKTEEINIHLEDLIDELEKSLDDEEKAEINPARLRQLVKALEKTADRKNAMRQYAELERQLRKAAQKLAQRKNEQLMAKVGQELQKDQETRQMGKKLAEKKFREAAKHLSKLEEAVDQPKRKLSDQRKELARVKAAAQRMASAAKAANRKGSTSSKSKSGAKSANKSSASQSKNSGSGKGQSGSGSGSSGSGSEGMEDLLAALDQSVKNLDNSLKNAEQEMKLNEKLSKKSLSQCNGGRKSVLSNLNKLNASLCKMGAKKECQSKLLSMCRKIGQCQGFLSNKQGMSLSQCMGTNPGGQKAGSGSVESRRDGVSDPLAQGGLEHLSGTKGSGPSQSTIESADDGSGVSSRGTVAKRRQFKQQMESFVQREDIPEDLKEGVKQYFIQIHGSGDAK